MAIASLVIGLVIVLGSLLPRLGMPIGFPIPLAAGMNSFPAAVVGLALGILAARKKSRRGIAIAGIALNALVLLFFVAIIISWAILGD